MVEQGGELHLLVFPCCFPHACQSLGHALPALRRERVRLTGVLLDQRPSLPPLLRQSRVFVRMVQASRFSCRKFLGVPWGIRPRRTEQELALSLLTMLPSAHINRVGARIVCFRGSIPTPPILYLRFAGSLTVAAQDSRPSGSLLLSCKALSSSPSCRFIPAHKHPHCTHPMRE